MGARFKLDENLPRAAAALLRDAGHDVSTVLEEHLGGSSDPAIIAACRNEQRILVTLDLDFSDFRLHPPESHDGIWVLRPRVQTIGAVVALLQGALAVLATESAQHRLWIVEPGRVRIRE